MVSRFRHPITVSVREAYSAAATRPADTHPFPVGEAFATSLGYPCQLLSQIPKAVVESFTGVSNVSIFADIRPGAIVLDVGCGSGLDVLVAAGRTGPSGRILGIDFSSEMLARARMGIAVSRPSHAEVCVAGANHLPLRSGTVDVALMNGILNLNPARAEILREVARVVRVGGAAYLAELILIKPLPFTVRFRKTNWFA